MTTIHHPAYLLDRVKMAAIRLLIGSMKGQVTGVAARQPFDELMERVPRASGIDYEAGQVGGVPGWWCRPAHAPDSAAILYLHGGGYFVGSALAFRHMVGQIASRAGVAAFVAEYRLAPEHPFPAALDDAQAAYQGLLDLGFVKIALVGDSAGGGLALALLSLTTARSRNEQFRPPCAAAVMSPWTDLALRGASMDTRAKRDPLSSRSTLFMAARMYLGEHDPRDPRASPLYGDLAGLPPVLLHVGDDEVLLDDTLRYAQRMESSGGTVQVHAWQAMIHVFVSNIQMLRAAREALNNIGEFLRQTLQER